MAVLVLDGAGYTGSYTVYALSMLAHYARQAGLVEESEIHLGRLTFCPTQVIEKFRNLYAESPDGNRIRLPRLL